jgi:hypothetical protein
VSVIPGLQPRTTGPVVDKGVVDEGEEKGNINFVSGVEEEDGEIDDVGDEGAVLVRRTRCGRRVRGNGASGRCPGTPGTPGNDVARGGVEVGSSMGSEIELCMRIGPEDGGRAAPGGEAWGSGLEGGCAVACGDEERAGGAQEGESDV